MDRYFVAPKLILSGFAGEGEEFRSTSEPAGQGMYQHLNYPTAGSALPGSFGSALAFASFSDMRSGLEGDGGSSGYGADDEVMGGAKDYGRAGGRRADRHTMKDLNVYKGVSSMLAQLRSGLQEFLTDDLEEPIMGIDTIRIHTSFGKLPQEWLFNLLKKRRDYSVRQVQLCVHSSLRPCLLDIDENADLAHNLTGVCYQFHAAAIDLRWYFLRPAIQVGVGLLRHPLANFVEKDMMKAIETLRDHCYDLTELLGEESTTYKANTATVSSRKRGLSISSSAMDIDEML